MRKKIVRVPATTNNLTKAIINFMLDRGHFVFRVNNGAVFDPKNYTFRRKGEREPSLSDIMGVLRPSGLFIGIEVKNAVTGDKAKSKQKLFAKEITDRGGLHYFAKRYDDFLLWYHDNIFDEKDHEHFNAGLDRAGLSELKGK